MDDAVGKGGATAPPVKVFLLFLPSSTTHNWTVEDPFLPYIKVVPDGAKNHEILVLSADSGPGVNKKSTLVVGMDETEDVYPSSPALMRYIRSRYPGRFLRISVFRQHEVAPSVYDGMEVKVIQLQFGKHNKSPMSVCWSVIVGKTRSLAELISALEQASHANNVPSYFR